MLIPKPFNKLWTDNGGVLPSGRQTSTHTDQKSQTGAEAAAVAVTVTADPLPVFIKLEFIA